MLVLQLNSTTPAELAATLRHHNDSDADGRPVQLVVLPEGAHGEGGETSLQNTLLAGLAAVLRQFRCWGVLGTAVSVLIL